MTKSSLTLAALTLLALPLAACTADSGANDREVADLRAELQRVRAESDKQRQMMSQLERRLNGLSDDMPRSRRPSAEETAAAPVADASAGAGGFASTGGPGTPVAAPGAEGALVPIDTTAMKRYFETEDGRSTVAAAVKAVQEQQEKERWQRGIDQQLARLVKEANLTEDQTTKMRDIMTRTSTQMRDMFQAARDGGGDQSPEARQAAFAKIGEIRTAAETEVRTVLSSTQFDVYQKSVQQTFGGFGGGPGGRGPGGGGRPGNN